MYFAHAEEHMYMIMYTVLPQGKDVLRYGGQAAISDRISVKKSGKLRGAQ